MFLVLATACVEPLYIDPPERRPESPLPESTLDSAGPGEWADPIEDIGEMEVDTDGMELTDAALAGDRLLLSGQHQFGDGHLAWAAGVEGARLVSKDGDELGPELALTGTWHGVLLTEDSIYTAGVDQIARYDLSGAGLAQAQVSGWCRDMALSDGVLAVACGSEGVLLLDATDLDTLGAWSGHVSARTVAGDEDHLWLAAWSELILLDAADLEDVHLVGSEPARSAAMGVVSAGDGQAHVADWNRPFTVRRQAVTAPEIRVSPANAIPGDRVSVFNDGTEALWVEAEAGTLSSHVVQPRESATLDIPGDYTAESLVLTSDDPDEASSSIEIGSMNGMALGEAAPDFEEYDLDSQLWTLEALRGEVVWLATFDDG